ncbi:hypothetical protein [Tatumella sp. UBA2305]|nr:hypothetical protein [Tatumella sp. UBA2305]
MESVRKSRVKKWNLQFPSISDESSSAFVSHITRASPALTFER